MDNFNRKLDILKGNVVPEEKINMIVDAHLNKHAPMDFCLKQLNMSEADFVKIVEQCKEKVKKTWKFRDGKRLYQWDSQHGDVEIYSTKNEVHLGSADKITGRTIKPAVKGEIK